MEKVPVELPVKAIPSTISRGVTFETFRKVPYGILGRISGRYAKEMPRTSARICGATSNGILGGTPREIVVVNLKKFSDSLLGEFPVEILEELLVELLEEFPLKLLQEFPAELQLLW